MCFNIGCACFGYYISYQTYSSTYYILFYSLPKLNVILKMLSLLSHAAVAVYNCHVEYGGRGWRSAHGHISHAQIELLLLSFGRKESNKQRPTHIRNSGTFCCLILERGQHIIIVRKNVKKFSAVCEHFGDNWNEQHIFDELATMKMNA